MKATMKKISLLQLILSATSLVPGTSFARDISHTVCSGVSPSGFDIQIIHHRDGEFMSYRNEDPFAIAGFVGGWNHSEIGDLSRGFTTSQGGRTIEIITTYFDFEKNLPWVYAFYFDKNRPPRSEEIQDPNASLSVKVYSRIQNNSTLVEDLTIEMKCYSLTDFG